MNMKSILFILCCVYFTSNPAFLPGAGEWIIATVERVIVPKAKTVTMFLGVTLATSATLVCLNPERVADYCPNYEEKLEERWR